MFKKYSCFIFCFVMFFAFQSNVLGKKIDGYERDCEGNVVPMIENKIGSPNVDTGNCTFNVNSKKQIIDNPIKITVPATCTSTTTPGKRVTRNIILIIDNSGSMTQGNKKSNVRKIFQTIAKQMQSGDKLKIRYFRDGGVGKDYNWNDLQGEKKIKRKAELVLKEGEKFGEKNVSLVTGTNTNFVDAIEDVNKWIKRQVISDTNVPIVYFITDGYPTEENNKKLGYASSAQYFYGAANAFNTLKKTLEKYTNAKFVTIGLGLDKSSSMAVKYLLNPNKNNKDALSKLKKNSSSNIEDYKFYQWISGQKISNKNLKKEFIFSVASNPDIAMTGYSSVSSDGKEFTFNKLSILDSLSDSDRDTINKKGFVIGPIETTSKSNVEFVKAGKQKITNFNWIPNFVKGKSFIELSGDNYNKLKNKKLVVKLKNKNLVADYKIGVEKKPEVVDLNGMVKAYYKINAKSDIGGIELNDIARWVHEGEKKDNGVTGGNTVIQTVRTHNGISEKHTLSLKGNFYVKDYDMISGNSNIIKVNQIQVEYLIDTSYEFIPGSLNESDNTAYSGGGFKFQNIKMQTRSIWYYKYYAATNIPMIQYQKSDGKWYNINYDAVYEDREMSKKKFENVNSLWDKIDEEVTSIIKGKTFGVKFQTVDSNDPDNEDSDVLTDDTPISFTKTNPTSSDYDTYYNIGMEYKVKESCFKNEKFSYSNCSSDSLTSQFFGEKYAYIDPNNRYYFVPFGYKKDKVNVTVDFGIKDYSTVCKIALNNGNPCSNNNNNNSSIEEQVSYRSIDKDNPFPRAAKKYYSIPLNWRSWYCDSSKTGDNCARKFQNQRRLSNSYSGGIYYSKDYKSQDLTQIANDTLNDAKYYYSAWDNIVSSTGKSKSIGNADDDIIKENNPSVKSYCPLGSFSSDCDGVIK